MLNIIRKDGEKIDSLLKRYKKKLRDSKIISDYKKYQEYEKPTTKKRKQKLKAVYTAKKSNQENS